MRESHVKDRSYKFAVEIVCLARALKKQSEYELAAQVLRSGTSIGANIEEALAGVSKADFGAKMCIASKEARECHYWLRLLRDTKVLPVGQLNPLLGEADAVIRMLTAIVKTTRAGHHSKLKTKNSKLKTDASLLAKTSETQH